jgi:hypothetical protein
VPIVEGDISIVFKWLFQFSDAVLCLLNHICDIQSFSDVYNVFGARMWRILWVMQISLLLSNVVFQLMLCKISIVM